MPPIETIFREGLHTGPIGRIFKELRVFNGIQYLTESRLVVSEPMHPGIHPYYVRNLE
tara:strand:+ start:562 stop:735 length:174 start_codon:yes stop_codon:yes gene_type:complete